MKRLLLLLAVFALLAVCASCAKPAEEPAPTAEPDYAPREITFEHVNVSIRGTDLMEKNGLYLSADSLNTLKNITLTAKVPLKQAEYVDASVFDPHIDLTGIDTWGTYDATVVYKILDPEYGKVVSVTPETVTLEVLSDDMPCDVDLNFSSVQITGADSLSEKSLMMAGDLEEQLKDACLTASVPLKNVNAAEPDSYSLRVDLSEIDAAGEYEIPIQYTNSKEFGEVLSVRPLSVHVTVEEYAVRDDVPVVVETEGEVPDEWMVIPSAGNKFVTVSGPADLVHEIDQARVVADLTGLEWAAGDNMAVAGIRLFDRNGEEIVDPLLTITNGTVVTDKMLLKILVRPASETRVYDIRDMLTIKGDPARGYRLAGITVSPEKLIVSSSSEYLMTLDAMTPAQLAETFLRTSEVDVSRLSETTSFEIRLLANRRLSSQSAIIATVTVEIVPEE